MAMQETCVALIVIWCSCLFVGGAGQTYTYTPADVVEMRGMRQNVAQFMPAYMSSVEYIEDANIAADLATDGDLRQGLFLSNGCAQTKPQDAPWWYVDLQYSIPIAVVRIWGRSDQAQTYSVPHVEDGVEIRVGDSTKWQDNEVCASNAPLLGVGRYVSVVNCFAEGRYVFIVAPKAKYQPISLCEVEILPRGPRTVRDWLGTIGRGMRIEIDGQSLHENDRIRIIEPTKLCGSSQAFNMDPNVVSASAPTGQRNGGNDEVEWWDNIVIKSFGFFKVCWCSGMSSSSCTSGRDFPFVAGYIVMSGELKTVIGNGDLQVQSDNGACCVPEDIDTVRVSEEAVGIAVADGGKTIYYSEPHRIRKVELEKPRHNVLTIAGAYTSGFTEDNGQGEYARFNHPTGLAVCNLAGANSRNLKWSILIADTYNNVIRAYDMETKRVLRIAGTGVQGYRGDKGPPLLAQLNRPEGIACEPVRGIWIADTGNSAIRLIKPDAKAQTIQDYGRWDFENLALIDTVVGGLGEGFSQIGSWSRGAQLFRPKQLALSVPYAGPQAPASALAYTEDGNAVARYMPLNAVEEDGAIMDVAGTGAPGWLQVARPEGLGDTKTTQMRAPTGIAASRSTVFVSEAENHRIIMVPILEYSSLGCWKGGIAEDGYPVIPSLEDHPRVQFEGDTETPPKFREEGSGMSTRPVAVYQCAKNALKLGYFMFAITGGGECLSSANAHQRYMFNGRSVGTGSCVNGLGGTALNSVYTLVSGGALDLLGRIYYVVGKAWSTGVGYNSPPTAGFAGDEQTSWDVSAVDTPRQIVRDEYNGNLYFVDSGNRRIRVLFGSLGPRPTNQFFKCINGQECNLEITGNAFGILDEIGFIPKGEKCGKHPLEAQFPNERTRPERSSIFSKKEFRLGKLRLSKVGQFTVCYCNYGAQRECADVDGVTRAQDFDFSAGTLTVEGPNSGQVMFVPAGVPFDAGFMGYGLTVDNRIRLFPAGADCEGSSTSLVTDTAQSATFYMTIINLNYQLLMSSWADLIEAVHFKIQEGVAAVAGSGNKAEHVEATLAQGPVEGSTLVTLEITPPAVVSLDDTIQLLSNADVGQSVADHLNSISEVGAVVTNAEYDISVTGVSSPTYGTAFHLARTEGTATYSVWTGLSIIQAADVDVCWCIGDANSDHDCVMDEEFIVPALTLHVVGPDPTQNITVQGNEPFDLTVFGFQGTGGFKVTDRVRLVPAAQGTCHQTNLQFGADDALPHDAAPCTLSPEYANWCNVVLPGQGNGDHFVCMCLSTGGCSTEAHFNVLAGKVLVRGIAAGTAVASGPWYRPARPLQPLNLTIDWPDKLYGGYKVDVEARAHTRADVHGAASLGDFHVSVCESRVRCLPDLLLRDVQKGAPRIAADTLTVPGDGPFQPQAILIEAVGADAWLPEYIDVAIDDNVRRFPINKWFLNVGRDGTYDGPWVDLTFPPRPALPSAVGYMLSDRCGGCPMGYRCLEKALDALTLLRLGEGAATTTWSCEPACGDGFVVGSEQCDDGNLQVLDGCDSNCQVEGNFECFTKHKQSVSVCKPLLCNTGYQPGVDTCGLTSTTQEALTGVSADVCRRWDLASLCASTASSAQLVATAEIFESEARCSQAVADAASHGEPWVCGGAAAWPEAVHVAVSDRGRALVVAFNAALKQHSAQDVANCTTVLTPSTIDLLGDGASCTWGSPRHLLAALGFGAKLGLPGEGLRSVGILGSVRAYRSLVPDVQAAVDASDKQSASTQTFLIGAGEEGTETPTVILKGPAKATAGCGDVTLDATASRGAGGRPWQSMVWECIGLGCSLLNDLLPNDCSNADVGYTAGPDPCGLTFTFPEVITKDLTNSFGMSIRITLMLRNAAGLSGSATHRIEFVTKRVPLATSHTPSLIEVLPDAAASLRFEVAATAANPSPGAQCGVQGLGPITIAWKVWRAENSEEAEVDASVFQDAEVPAQALVETRMGVLEGTLGEYAVPGSAWFVSARVANVNALKPADVASPVYVTYRVEVQTSAPLQVKLEAPAEVSDDCAFQIKAVISGGRSNETEAFTWSCVRDDIVPGRPNGYDKCAIVASSTQGDTLSFDSPLVAGVYRINVLVRESGSKNDATCSKAQCTKTAAVVTVTPDVGPPLRFLEPATDMSIGGTGGSDDSMRVRVAMGNIASTAACAPGTLTGAVIAIGSAPDTTVPMLLDAQVVAKDLQMAGSSIDGGGSGSVLDVPVNLSKLAPGINYRFQLLLAPEVNKTALNIHVQRLITTGALKDSAPLAARPPAGIWVRESPTVLLSLPAVLALYVQPPVGLSAQTNFRVRARDNCEDCEYAFRVGQMAHSDTTSISPIQTQMWFACAEADSAVASWGDLRAWGADPEVWTPLLRGAYIFEVSARRADGRTTRACAAAEATDSGLTAQLAVAQSVQKIDQLISHWLGNVTQTIDTLLSQGRPDFSVMALNAIANEFPDVFTLRTRNQNAVTPDMSARLLEFFMDFCSILIDTTAHIDSSAFAPVLGRRLALAVTDQLESIAASVVMAYKATERLFLVPNVERALDVVETILSRNSALKGLLGTQNQGGAPPSAAKLLGVLDYSFNSLSILGNRTNPGGDVLAATTRVMDLVRRVADAVIARLPKDQEGPPLQITSDGMALMTVIVQHFSKAIVRDEGFTVNVPYSSVMRPKYPGIIVPGLGENIVANLSTSLQQTSPCLGEGVWQPLDTVGLLIVEWGRNPHAIGRLTGSRANPDAAMVDFREIELRTCGIPIPLTPEQLDDPPEVRQLWELPAEELIDRRWGYGDQSAFRCVRYAPNGNSVAEEVDGPSAWWPSIGCRSIYRPLGVAASTDRDWVGLPEGHLRCICDGLWPTTWAIEMVPRPDHEDPPESVNRSINNLVTHAFVIFWLAVLPLLCCATYLDARVDFDDDSFSARISEAMPWLPSGGAREVSAATLAKRVWPIRSELCQDILGFIVVLSDLLSCGKQEPSLEVHELAEYRRVRAAKRKGGWTDGEFVQTAPPDKTDPFESGKKSAPMSKQTTKELDVPKQSRFGLSGTAASYKGVAPSTKYNPEDSVPLHGRRTPDAFNKSPRSERSKQAFEDLSNRLNTFNADSPEHSRQPAFNPNWDNDIRNEVANVGASAAKYDAPLPEGWVSKPHGEHTYYVNLLNGQSTWDRPQLPAVKVLSVAEIRGLLGPNADKYNLRRELEDLLRPRIAERLLQMQMEDQQLPGAANPRLRTEARHRAPPPMSPPSSIELDPDWSKSMMCSHQRRTSGHDAADGQALRFAATMTHSPRPCVHEVQRHSPGAVRMDVLPRVVAPAPLSPPRPVKLFLPETTHAAAMNGAALDVPKHQHTLRFAARAKAEFESASNAGDPDGIIMPLSLAFVRWSFCYIAWMCLLRRFPPTAVMAPQLVMPQTRLRRLAALTARLAAGLLLAAVLAILQQWGEDPLSDDVIAADRSFGELWGELSAATGQTVVRALGILCYIGGAVAQGLLSIPPSLRGAGQHNRVVWWHSVQKLQRRNAYLMFGAAFVFWISAIIVAAINPQPRAAVGLGAFAVMVCLHFLVVPVVLAPLDALVIWCSAHCRCCCHGLLGALLSQRPALLDFAVAQVKWYTPVLLLHAEDVAAERHYGQEIRHGSG